MFYPHPIYGLVLIVIVLSIGARLIWLAAPRDMVRQKDILQPPADAAAPARLAIPQQSDEQMAQSQKMHAVGQLAGGIAHDFNNLLTAILGYCDLLLLRHKPGDPSFADIMQIRQNTNRGANLVRQLLAFSRQQTLKPKLHDPVDVLTDLSHLLRRLIGENIKLTQQHGRELGLILIDLNQMEQVMINLAVNARDAMPQGGEVSIHSSAFHNTKELHCVGEAMPPGDWVEIAVCDTGTGIDPGNLVRIFDPFFSTKEIGKGTGLGLATVFGIVKQSGGYIAVKSELGKGTAFRIFLPQHDASEAQAVEQKTEAPKKADTTGAGTILLTEDEDAVRSFAARALKHKGYKVLEADCGRAALEVFAKEGGHINLLISDVVMPEMDGPTLYTELLKQNPDLRVIFVSGYTEERLKDHLSGDNHNVHFLAKPFSLQELAEKVKDVLASH